MTHESASILNPAFKASVNTEELNTAKGPDTINPDEELSPPPPQIPPESTE